jgi:UDP-GlcNAc:undecaprenyl-phosphate GlcNAc-1-phosphate transferase
MSSAFLITTACLLLLRPVALKIGLTDKPSTRKKHNGEIPLIGGLAIYLCMVYFIWAENKLTTINIGFLTAATLIIVTGVIDDFQNLDLKVRFSAEIVAILIMIKWGGVEITSLGDLFGFGEIQLGLFSTPFTVFAILGGINAFNMIDGIDGLAGGTSLILYLILGLLFVTTHYTNLLLLCAVLAGATTAFLFFNLPTIGRKKASIFLGDAGSMMLGFTISVLIISASQGDHKIFHPVTALWLIASPLLDTLTIMMQRKKYGRSPFAPDREHLHHLLPITGYGRYTTLGIILIFSLLLALTGLTLDLVLHVPEWLMFSLFIMVFISYRCILSYTWKMLKVARYLQNNSTDINRRASNSRRLLYHRPLVKTDKRLHRKRRILSDRRYQATAADIKEFNESRFQKKYEPHLLT